MQRMSGLSLMSPSRREGQGLSTRPASCHSLPMPDLRPATKDDAATIVALMDMASHGMARALWAALAPPETDVDTFAIARAQREQGGFSYRNTRILMLEDQPAGMLMCWNLPQDLLPLTDMPEAGQGPQALITGSDNAAALALYRAAGFTETARRPAVGDANWPAPPDHWSLLCRVT